MIKTNSRTFKVRNTKARYKLKKINILRVFDKLKRNYHTIPLNDIEMIIQYLKKKLKDFDNMDFVLDANKNNKIIKDFEKQILRLRKEVFKLNAIKKELPKVLNVSQSHEINTLRDTITGADKERFNENIIVEINDYDGSLTSVRDGKNRTEIKISEFGNIKQFLNEKLCKLLDVIFYNLDQHYRKGYIEIPIEHYIEYTGRKLTKNNLKDIPKKELKDLLKVLNGFNITSIKRKSTYSYVRPFSRAEYRKGYIVIGFDNLFVESINKDYFTLPKEVGSLKGNAYHIANYIYLYARQSKKIEFSLKNKTLYEYSGLPRYDEVKEGTYKGDITKAIIDPYSKALFQIKEILQDDIEITEELYEGENWEAFKGARIHIKVKNEEVINNVKCIAKARKKQIENAKKRAEKKKEKQA